MDINKFRLLDKESLLKALKINNHEDVINILENKKINGSAFLQISERDLVQWHLNFGQKKSIWSCIAHVNENPSKYIVRKPSQGKSDIRASALDNNFKGRLEGLLGSTGNTTGSSRTLPRPYNPSGNRELPHNNISTLPRVAPRPKPPIPKKDMAKISAHPASSANAAAFRNRPSLPLPQTPDSSVRPPALPPSELPIRPPILPPSLVVKPLPSPPIVPLPPILASAIRPPPLTHMDISVRPSIVPPSPVGKPPPLPPSPRNDYLEMTAPPQTPKSAPKFKMQESVKPVDDEDDSDYLMPNEMQENEYEAEPPHNAANRFPRPPLKIPEDMDFPPPPPPMLQQRILPVLEKTTGNNLRVFLPPPPQTEPSEDYEPMEDIDLARASPSKDKTSPNSTQRRNSFLKIKDSFKKLIRYENVVIVEPEEKGKTQPADFIIKRPLPPIPDVEKPVPVFNIAESPVENIHFSGLGQRPLPSLPVDNHLSASNIDEVNDVEDMDSLEDNNHLDDEEEPIYENIKIHTDNLKIEEPTERKIPAHLTGLIANLTKALEKQKFTVGMRDDDFPRHPTLVGLSISPPPFEPQVEPDLEESPEYGNYNPNPSTETEAEQLYGNLDPAIVDDILKSNSCSKCKTGPCACKLQPGVSVQSNLSKTCSCSKSNCGCNKKLDPQTADQAKSCGCAKLNCGCSRKPEASNVPKSCGCTKPNCGCSRKPKTVQSPQSSTLQPHPDKDEYYNTVLNLNNEPFYRNTDRKGARLLLKNLEDGSFVVRPSKKHYLALTVKYGKKIYNLGIVKTSNNRLECDCKGDNPLDFATVREFIEHFEQEPLTLQDVDETVSVTLKSVLK